MASYPALDLQYVPATGADTLTDLLSAELDAFEPLAIHEDDAHDTWRVFFRTPGQRDAARTAMMALFGDRLAAVIPIDVDDEDWARRSQASLKAIRAGAIIVAPPWDVPDDGGQSPVSSLQSPGSSSHFPVAGDIVIVIEPSMGFGTGHHATTRLCLELLQTIDVRGKHVVDVGTGSGVLAIAARRLGAGPVAAVDNDPDALQNARENIERNRLSGTIEVIEVDLGDANAHGGSADLVLANLTGAVLQRHARVLAAMPRSGGTLIVSGFGPDELDGVANALRMKVEQSIVDGEWAAAKLQVP